MSNVTHLRPRIRNTHIIHQVGRIVIHVIHRTDESARDIRWPDKPNRPPVEWQASVYLVASLPGTEQTQHTLCKSRFSRTRRGAFMIALRSAREELIKMSLITGAWNTAAHLVQRQYKTAIARPVQLINEGVWRCGEKMTDEAIKSQYLAIRNATKRYNERMDFINDRLRGLPA